MRTRIAVYGAVQGVGFRWFVQRNARHADLHGWVRNRDDGAVEIEAQGPESRIAEFLRTVQHGPPMARVDRIENLAPTDEPLPDAFDIRH